MISKTLLVLGAADAIRPVRVAWAALAAQQAVERRAADTVKLGGRRHQWASLGVPGWKRRETAPERRDRLDGTATPALTTPLGFGWIGSPCRQAALGELRPGSFVNLNRLNKTGHAVVFLGYLDRRGEPLDKYGPGVAGFKYFSSQGKSYSPGSGFGYRHAFFNVAGRSFCPKLSGGRKVDCGIIFQNDQNMLNTGYMLIPELWDLKYRDASLQQIATNLYRQNHGRGQDDFRLGANLTEVQFLARLAEQDTMSLNPIYADQTMPEETTNGPGR